MVQRKMSKNLSSSKSSAASRKVAAHRKPAPSIMGRRSAKASKAR